MPRDDHPHVLFDGRDMQLLHLPGATPYSLVTFHAMYARANGRSGFALNLARKCGIDLYMVVPTAPNWYPVAEARVCAQLIAARKDRPSIGYGASMGGYGVLKHARAMGTDASLAFSPQITIDPAVTGNDDRRYARHFDAAANGDMAVRQADLAPRTYIVCDPDFRHDVYQRDLLGDGFTGIDLPSLGHRAATAMTPSRNATQNFEDALAGRTDALVARLRQASEQSLQYAIGETGRALDDGRFADAATLIDDAAETFEAFATNNAARILRARAYAGIGRPEVGIGEMRQVLGTHPHLAMNRRLLADLLVASGQPDAAIAELSEAVEQSDNAVLAVFLSKLLVAHRPELAADFAVAARVRWPERAAQFAG